MWVRTIRHRPQLPRHALAAGPLGAVEGAPIVLSEDTALDPETAAFVKTHAWATALSSVTIFGGPNAVTRPVADTITRVVHGKAAY